MLRGTRDGHLCYDYDYDWDQDWFRAVVAGMNNECTQDSAADGRLLVRAFVAVRLDDAVRSALSSAIGRLRSCPARVAWVPATNLHLSVAFLGNVPLTMIERLAATLDEAVAGVGPFVARVGGVGTFGRRIVWAGVEAHQTLIEIQRRVVDGVSRMGVPGEERPYQPHITLGRIRSGAGDLPARLRRLGTADFGTLSVNEVALMQSELRAAHAVYSPLHVTALGDVGVESEEWTLP